MEKLIDKNISLNRGAMHWVKYGQMFWAICQVCFAQITSKCEMIKQKFNSVNNLAPSVWILNQISTKNVSASMTLMVELNGQLFQHVSQICFNKTSPENTVSMLSKITSSENWWETAHRNSTVGKMHQPI